MVHNDYIMFIQLLTIIHNNYKVVIINILNNVGSLNYSTYFAKFNIQNSN